MKLEIYPEECCELCGNIVHNHMECPICNNSYAGTDQYDDLYDCIAVGEIMQCECGARFKLITKDGWRGDWEWEHCVDTGEQTG